MSAEFTLGSASSGPSAIKPHPTTQASVVFALLAAQQIESDPNARSFCFIVVADVTKYVGQNTFDLRSTRINNKEISKQQCKLCKNKSSIFKRMLQSTTWSAASKKVDKEIYGFGLSVTCRINCCSSVLRSSLSLSLSLCAWSPVISTICRLIYSLFLLLFMGIDSMRHRTYILRPGLAY